MEHFYQNLEGENWFDYEMFYLTMVDRFPSGSHFVELGTWRGKSAAFMAVEIINSGKKIRFDCIDNWSQGDTKDECLKNLEPVKDHINIIEGISWEAASLYKDNSIDFCFVDAAHDYESKVKDVTAWLPKIKSGGVIAGHDYNPNMDDYNRTYEAINDVLGKNNISVIKNLWIYEKH